MHYDVAGFAEPQPMQLERFETIKAIMKG